MTQKSRKQTAIVSTVLECFKMAHTRDFALRFVRPTTGSSADSVGTGLGVAEGAAQLQFQSPLLLKKRKLPDFGGALELL